MDEPSEPSLPRDSGTVAAYVAAMAAELSQMARASGLSTLAYILDMARLEARGCIDAQGKRSGGEPG